jgi:hypothetical protein
VASPPSVTGPFIVANDDGVDTEFVDEATNGAASLSTSTGVTIPIEKLDVRFMSMDPDAYEVAEGIAEIFDSLDENGDNQITFDEFLNGARRHPELLELFFKEDGEAAAGAVAQHRHRQSQEEGTMEIASSDDLSR